MDYNKFKTFIEVVELGGFTKAAKSLLRSQQAISQQIQTLEQELNLTLFDRLGPNIELSKDGSFLYQEVKSYFTSIDNTVQGLIRNKKELSGTIKIGCWMEQGINYIPNIIAGFKKKFPAILFEVEIATDTELKEMLYTNKVDFVFLLQPDKNSLIETVPVFRRNLILVASKKYLSTMPKIRTVEDTLELDLLDYPSVYSAYNAWIKKNAKEVLTPAKKKIPVVTVANDVILKELTMRHLGMAIVPKESIESEIRLGKLIPILGQRTLPVKVEIDLAYKKRQVLSIIEQEFLNFVTLSEHGNG
jgi:DNA-binding transcriptional LysR family regulator